MVSAAPMMRLQRNNPIRTMPAFSASPKLPFNLNYLPGLVQQLGQYTQLGPNNIVQMNWPLIQSITPYKEKALPFLQQHLQTLMQYSPMPELAVVETLHTMQRVGEQGVNIRPLYGVTSRLNYYPSPLVKIYLAELYEQMQEPESFGPVMVNLLQSAQQPQTSWQTPQHMDPNEALGDTFSTLLANKIVKQLQKRV